MKKIQAYWKISEFGRLEERELLNKNKFHEAYQIQHVRDLLLATLTCDSIKEVKAAMVRMVTEGSLSYIRDVFARNLLIDFKAKF